MPNDEHRNPSDPLDTMSSALSRAVDGKVAVVERGGPPKIVTASDVEGESKDNGNGASEPTDKAAEETEAKVDGDAPKVPAGKEPVSIDDSDAEQIREALQAMRNFEGQLAQIRIQYREQEDSLIENRKTSQTELNATIKSIAKRNKVEDGWIVNLDLMQFEPPKRQPYPFTPRR